MGKRAALTAVVSAAVLATTLSTPAIADHHTDDADVQVVAHNLNSPRGLSFAPNGDLYIAESGAMPASPPGPCFEHPQFDQVCLDFTGSITRLSKHGTQSRVVTGLPSAASQAEANGPFDVVLHGNTLSIAMGMGGSLEHRNQLGADGALLGTVVDAKVMGTKTDVTLRADLLAYEAANDPAGDGIDVNPAHLSFDGRDLVVVDAGANAVLQVGKKGGILGVRAVLDPVVVADPPPFLGLPPDFPAQPVPTSAVQGPDGAWYISQLTGFPFPGGGSTVYRLADGQLQPWATGLTTVTDLAWDGDELYAVQITNDGLGILTGDFSGSLVGVEPGGDHTTVADLYAPYGVAIRDGYAYVTTGSVAPGGEVVRVALR